MKRVNWLWAGLAVGVWIVVASLGTLIAFLFMQGKAAAHEAPLNGRRIVEKERPAVQFVRAGPYWQTANDTRYTVQPGDTLFGIARRFGITVQAIVQANALFNPDFLLIGQSLLIPGSTAVVTPPPEPMTATLVPEPQIPSTPSPSPDQPLPPAAQETVYVVQRGDTLFAIARRFNTTVMAIMAVNAIPNPRLIYPGQSLRLVPYTPGSPVEVLPTNPPSLWPTPLATAVPTPLPDASLGLIWPNDYRGLYQRFRYGHGAVDIAMPVGTPILAAAGGVVEFSGWHAHGFGYLVILDHGQGLRTMYAHNSELLVTGGQPVVQGDMIALSGSTGISTHPHLHFGITEHLRLVDPCTRLPGGC